jgi:ATP-dependent helicase/nuclease subunit A
MPPSILRGERTDNVTPTMRGTATHLFLQFCDHQRLAKNGVSEEMAYLTEKGFIPSDSERLVFTEELEAFVTSELFATLSRAKRIVREQRFNILLPPSSLSTNEDFLRETEGEMLAVQGVIDLLFENEEGEFVLCDYKTDRLTLDQRRNEEALKAKMTERHAKQLRYYKEAIEALYSRKCDKVLIYSTHAAKTVKIDV